MSLKPWSQYYITLLNWITRVGLYWQLFTVRYVPHTILKKIPYSNLSSTGVFEVGNEGSGE